MGHTVSSSCPGTSFGDERTTDLDFTDYAVIFAETMEVLVVSLDVLSRGVGEPGIVDFLGEEKDPKFHPDC